MITGMNELISALVDAARLGSSVQHVESIARQGLINRHDVVVLDDGSRFVARTYGWPFAEPETIDRQTKEVWLLAVLEEAGVPVPQVVASVPGAILMRYVDGELLGDAPSDVRAWADVDLTEIRGVLTKAQSLLDLQPVRLIHNDPHPWNVLVRNGRCVSWLDWEFAWAADPTWDLVRNALFRVTDIGSTPREFYEGYGRESDPTLFAIYELAVNLWMANEARYSDRIPVTYRAAERYVTDLPERLARLHSLVA
jgi:aminoglycoside phosphotransferase (APT) family kinase protein